MSATLFAIILAIALILLVMAFWLNNAAFGVASASLFIILGGLILSGNATIETGVNTVSELNSTAFIDGNVTNTNSTTTTEEVKTSGDLIPGFFAIPLALLLILLGIYVILQVVTGDKY